jgi:cytochrome b561
MLKDKPVRYHPMQVGFHWLVVLLLFSMFLLGKYMSGLPNDAGKILPLGIHILLGVVTIVVIVVRFIARFRLPQPVPARTNSAVLDVIGKVVHYALYALVLLMAVSGISLSLRAGLLPIVFGGSGAALPADFFVYSARALHGATARVLLVTVVLHVGAALYHQFWLKDKLLSRMWFVKKPIEKQPE